MDMISSLTLQPHDLASLDHGVGSPVEILHVKFYSESGHELLSGPTHILTFKSSQTSQIFWMPLDIRFTRCEYVNRRVCQSWFLQSCRCSLPVQRGKASTNLNDHGATR
ncbi:hypothetical protein BDR05DRAFT_409793 [Suillus weaverae]|nr:hypothetical protein BDR05DRAFT_409793 [Suillus weaverae]